MPRLDGYDAAHYQFDNAPPDLAAALIAGLWWIAWKATQSTQYVDPTFARIRATWQGFRMRGMYHWLSSTTDVAAQAAHYLRTIGTLARGEFCMLDAEEKGITAEMCLRWCELVEAVTHRPVVIYTGLYVAGGSIWKSDALRISKYGPRPFIVAAYVTEANLELRMRQTGSLPNYPRQAWQFSSNGPVPGVTGRCDMDQVDNVAAFELACAISDIPHPPMPDPGDDDMKMYFLSPIDGPARFIGEGTDNGLVRRCEWTGDGNDPAVQARIAFFKGAGMVDMVLSVGDLINVSLDGPLPPGWTGDEFANADELKAAGGGTTDQVARDGVAQLNEAVGRLGQRQAAGGKELEQAAAAFLGT